MVTLKLFFIELKRVHVICSILTKLQEAHKGHWALEGQYEDYGK